MLTTTLQGLTTLETQPVNVMYEVTAGSQRFIFSMDKLNTDHEWTLRHGQYHKLDNERILKHGKGKKLSLIFQPRSEHRHKIDHR